MMSSEDQDSEEGEYLEEEMSQYRVCYSHSRKEEVDFSKKEDGNKKRCPVGRHGNHPGRVKRVVSCKRKTHRHTVARRRPSVSGRCVDVATKENEQACRQDTQETFYMDPWDYPPDVNHPSRTEETGSKYIDFFTELSKDHNTMTEVLSGRHLRLSVALTLWQRNIGELLTYLLRVQDTAVFVDVLPVITKSLNDESSSISIGCCVDLFPLVKNVLTSPYEEYLTVGLRWVQSVLTNWWQEFSRRGGPGTDSLPLDGNVQVFKQQLQDLWSQESYLSLVPGMAGEIAKGVDSYLSQLR